MECLKWLRRMSPIILSVASHLTAYALVIGCTYLLLGWGWKGISATIFAVFLLNRLFDYMPLLAMALSFWVHPKDSSHNVTYEDYFMNRMKEVYQDDKFLQGFRIYLEYLRALLNQSRIDTEVDEVLEEFDEVFTKAEDPLEESSEE